MVCANFDQGRLAGNPFQQFRRIGEFTVAELNHQALWTGIEFLDIGCPAQPLDEDDFQKVINFLRQLPEPVDHLSCKGIDLLCLGYIGQTTIQ